MKINDFIKAIEALNINYDEKQLNELETYYNYLIEYNRHTNLTAIIEKEAVYLKHFYDSLTLVKAIDFSNVINIIDIGSGAGFPGIVLKIFFPHLDITILDSNGKKTTFISHLVETLNLKNITVVNARAEDYAKDKLNSFDLCVSRAVAYIDIICELSFPFIKKDGKVVLMKGNISNEMKILTNYQQDLNIKKYDILNFSLPFTNDERNLIVLSKSIETKKLLNYSQIIKRNKKWNGQK